MKGSATARTGGGFSMLEVLVTVAILAVIAALAVPSAVRALQAYRLHADASAVGNFLNVGRMRAASQYKPYSLNLDSTPTPPTYVLEQLASATYDPLNPSFAGAYASQSPQVFEIGTQYLSQGTTIAICRPSGITAYPGSVTADPSSCTGLFRVCFNTRGLPAQCTGSPGNPLTNGGLAIYLQNAQGLTDAVTVATGGAVQVWNWNTPNSTWYLR